VSALLIARLRLPVVAAAAVVVALPLLASPAQALGNNRTVERGCGKNWVASGHNGPSGGGRGHSWAQTKKVSGTCKGRLSAALQRNDGYWSTRVYGSNQGAYATATFPDRARYGLHWGCDACGVTRS
jgi:hypothetical protein